MVGGTRNMIATLLLWLGSTAFQHSLLQNIRWEQADFFCLSPKAEGKAVHVHTVTVSRGNGGIAPFICNFGSKEVSGQCRIPATLTPGKDPRCGSVNLPVDTA